VHDVRGAVVARLVDGMQGAGPQTARWNGRGTRGAVVAPGVYLIRLETGSGHATGKCVFLK